LLLGWCFHRFLRAWSRGDALATPATTYFSAAIGGASEKAVLAERHGGAVDRVAAAHSLRVLIVVASVPLALQAAGVHGVDASLPVAHGVHLPGLAALVLASTAGVWAMRRAGLPNPYVLVALAVTMGFTGSGHPLSALPPGASSAAQLFIGVSLGARFTPQFVHSAPRWLGGIALGTLGMLLASALFAWLLARLIAQHPASVILGNVPGGIAEMAITAAVLHLGVPVVTAFHLVRYVAVLTLTAPLFRRELRRLRP
jgi:membrane AbrB-like protein